MPLTDPHKDIVTSGQPVVGIEAAAGAGKTHLACELALSAVDTLHPWQSVLFLSHTNAARDVFRNRLRSSPGADRVVLRTLDSFAIDLISPYAQLLGLPSPLRPPVPIPDGWFKSVRRKAARLLEKKPAIAHAVVARFPLILADEHQDAARQHHALLLTLAEAGARVRVLGDALQAILTFDPDIPGWDELMRDIPVVQLSGSWRWSSNLPLGEWVDSIRMDLRANRPIRLDDLPPCVRLEIADHHVSQPWHRSHQILESLRTSRQLSGFMVLTRTNRDAKLLARHTDLELVVHEGADLSLVDEAISNALHRTGNVKDLLEGLADFMTAVGTVPDSVDDQLRALPSGDPISEVSSIIRELKRTPDLLGFIRAVGVAEANRRTLGWTISHPVAVQTIRRLPRDVSTADIRELAYRAQRVASEAQMPSRCVSTIHKAKGRECDHVVVPCVDARTFQPRADDRHLLYVALSRAKLSVTMVVPRGHPSPLVTLPPRPSAS